MSKREEAREVQSIDAVQHEYAEKVFLNILKISVYSPLAATQMLKIESKHGGNPYMQKLQGITFNAPTKDGWATIGLADGYVYHTYLPTLQQALEAGPNSDIYKNTIIRIGEGGALLNKRNILFVDGKRYTIQ